MVLKGTVEIEDKAYRRDLELAFVDYLDEDERTLDEFRKCVRDRLEEDFTSDIIMDEETITQAVEDAKRFIRETLKTI